MTVNVKSLSLITFNLVLYFPPRQGQPACHVPASLILSVVKILGKFMMPFSQVRSYEEFRFKKSNNSRLGRLGPADNG